MNAKQRRKAVRAFRRSVRWFLAMRDAVVLEKHYEVVERTISLLADEDGERGTE